MFPNHPVQPHARRAGAARILLLALAAVPVWAEYGETRKVNDVADCPAGWAVVSAPPPGLAGSVEIKDLRGAKPGTMEVISGRSPIPEGWTVTEIFKVTVASSAGPIGRTDQVVYYRIRFGETAAAEAGGEVS